MINKSIFLVASLLAMLSSQAATLSDAVRNAAAPVRSAHSAWGIKSAQSLPQSLGQVLSQARQKPASLAAAPAWLTGVNVTSGVGPVIGGRTALDRSYSLAEADATLAQLGYTRNFFNNHFAAYTQNQQPNAVVIAMFQNGAVKEVGVLNPNIFAIDSSGFSAISAANGASWNVYLSRQNYSPAKTQAEALATYAAASYTTPYTSAAVSFSADARTLIVSYWNASNLMNEAVLISN